MTKIRISICIAIIISVFILLPLKAEAIIDPLATTNNVFGIHILFTEELNDAGSLVNSNGGDWGYVTIPIQSKDKDLEKWQNFMDRAKELHLIPIIRLSTEEDQFIKGVWRKPDEYDIIDFANFLSSLTWPVKNRYIILFNEINRFDEWGGEYPDPAYYTSIVDLAYGTFKDRSEDYFVILGGFDNASVNNSQYMNEFEFLRQMYNNDADIFNKIDGFASHSYPNPGFSQPPSAFRRMSTSTYKFESNYINSLSSSKKYAFITETGWDNRKVNPKLIGEYYKQSFDSIWKNDNSIVAVTPFLLKGEGQFDMFTFFKNNQPTDYYKSIQDMKKLKGDPVIEEHKKMYIIPKPILQEKNFSSHTDEKQILKVPVAVKLYLQLIFGLM